LRGVATLCVGIRGMIYTELEVRGAKTDLHSGMYGGAATEPVFALAQILAKLKDEDGAHSDSWVLRRCGRAERGRAGAWRSLPFDEEHYRLTEVGSKELVGEKGYSRVGTHGGEANAGGAWYCRRFIGAGAKTVIPAKATAKISNAAGAGYDASACIRTITEFREKIVAPGWMWRCG